MGVIRELDVDDSVVLSIPTSGGESMRIVVHKDHKSGRKTRLRFDCPEDVHIEHVAGKGGFVRTKKGRTAA